MASVVFVFQFEQLFLFLKSLLTGVSRYNIEQEQKLALETTVLVEQYSVSAAIEFYHLI